MAISNTISIRLLNQDIPEKYHESLLSFGKLPGDASGRVTEGDSNSGWGYSTFIAHVKLTEYLKDDSLCFKVSLSHI